MFSQVSLAHDYDLTHAHPVLMGSAQTYQSKVAGCEIRAGDGYVQVIVPGPGFSCKTITLRLSRDEKTLCALAPARYFSYFAQEYYHASANICPLRRAYREVDWYAPTPTVEVKHPVYYETTIQSILHAMYGTWSIPVGGRVA